MLVFIWHKERETEPTDGGTVATTILPQQSVTPKFSSHDGAIKKPNSVTGSPEYSRSSTLQLPSPARMNPGSLQLAWPRALVSTRSPLGPGPGAAVPAASRRGIFRPSHASRICYVVDQSGSMIDTFDILKAELKRSIVGLNGDQQFQVIFFSDGATEYPSRRFLRATPLNKRRVLEWIDGVVNQGQTNPQAAMIRALELRPEKILFLTDGDFDEKLVTLLRRRNRSSIAIDTYAYLNHDGARLLRQISDDSGGIYTPISWQQLGR